MNGHPPPNILKESLSDYHLSNLRDESAGLSEQFSGRRKTVIAAVTTATIAVYWLADAALAKLFIADRTFGQLLISNVPGLLLIHRLLFSAAIISIAILAYRLFNSSWLSTALTRSSKWFSTTMASMGAALIAVDRKGTVIFMNQMAQKLTARPLSEAVGAPINDVCFVTGTEPGVQYDYHSYLKNILDRGTHYRLPEGANLQRPDGTQIAVAGDAAPIKEGTNIIGAVVVIHDRTEYRKAENEALRFVTLIEQAEEGIVLLDRSGFIEYVNPGLIKLSGYSEYELVGEHVKKFQTKRNRSQAIDVAKQVLTEGNAWHGRFEFRKEDETIATLQGTVFPIVSPKRDEKYYALICRDVTRDLQIEKTLNQAEKMDAVGRLASGLAHDFKNILTVIDGFNTIRMAELKEDDPAYADAYEISRAVQNAKGLLKQLFAFTREGGEQPVLLSPPYEIREMEKMIRPLIGPKIKLYTNLAPDTFQINVDPNLFRRVILNLAINAADAITSGSGEIRIETNNIQLLQVHNADMNITPGEYVRLEFQDNGCGLTADQVSQIFEPFYTTKTGGKGTGLGLSITYGFMKQIGGDVKVISELGNGTTFQLFFPAARIDTHVVRKRMRPPTKMVNANDTWKTILVVDDRRDYLDSVAGCLKNSTFTILTATAADEALAVMNDFPGDIDILLTDIVLPDLNGYQLADLVRAKNPGTKVIYMSGFMDDTVVEQMIKQAGQFCIAKPFGQIELVNMIEKVLATQVREGNGHGS